MKCSVCELVVSEEDLLKRPDGTPRKQCRKCKNKTTRAWYHRTKGERSEYYAMMRDKHRDEIRQRNREWYYKNKEKSRNGTLMRLYGISVDDFDSLLSLQRGVCASCEENSEKTLHVDHNHVTGEIRGLICDSCNLALGWARECPVRLRKLSEYITRTNKLTGANK